MTRVVGNRAHPLTPADVTQRLGVSEMSVRRWVLDGRLEGVRLGEGQLARYRVSEDALDRFVRPAAPREVVTALPESRSASSPAGPGRATPTDERSRRGGD